MLRPNRLRIGTDLALGLGLSAALLGCDPGASRKLEPAMEKSARPDKPPLGSSPRGLHVEPDRDPAPAISSTDVKNLEADAAKAGTTKADTPKTDTPEPDAPKADTPEPDA